MDVTFVDVDFVASGNFEYVGGLLTYTGEETLEMTLNLSCSIACDTKDRRIHLMQYQNGELKEGSQNVSKSESNTSLTPFSIDAPFVLETGDTLNLRISSDGACTVSISHFSVVLETNKIVLV